MATKQLGDDQPCRLLACPREIRDQIYAEILLDFPTPTVDKLLDCALPLPLEDGGPSGPGSWKYRSYCYESRPAYEQYELFHTYAAECLETTHEIETNILLTNRQIFAEAKQMILRRGRLVKVTASKVSLAWRLCASQLCLIHPKYSSLCIMTHHLHHNPKTYDLPDYSSEFVLCEKDVAAFCRAIIGDLAFILRPQLCSGIRHTLAFTSNFREEYARSSFLARHNLHRQALQPFRKYLRGFSDVSLQGSCVGLSRVLAATALKDFRSQLIPDPDELVSELRSMYSQYKKLLKNDSTDFGCLVAPLEKAIDLCIRATRNSNVWKEVQRKASDPRAFVEKMIRGTYHVLLVRLVAHVEYTRKHYRRRLAADPEVAGISIDITPPMQTYEMCLVIAKRFKVPGWTPKPRCEMCMNHRVAEDLAIYMTSERKFGVPLAIGYKAAQRALELEPGNEKLKRNMEWYDARKRMALQMSPFFDIADGVLEKKGMIWWSGYRARPGYKMVLAVDEMD